MREIRHHSKPILLDRARKMRREPAPAEALLWSRLRAGQLDGLKFRRQQPIGDFIADFFCPMARIVVELDGDSHDQRGEYDKTRTLWLNIQGIDVVRYTNTEIFENLDSLLEDLLGRCRGKLAGSTVSASPSPRPSPARGEGER